MAKRILAVQESDLRMDGDLAMNIQRVLPVTQADINTAAQNGEHWLVERVIEVTAPIDNSHGETLRVIKQNQILPGQNVLRVLIQSAPQTVQTTVGPAVSPLALNNALDSSLTELTAFGGTYQGLPDGYTALKYIENTAGTDVDLGVAFDDDDFEVIIRATAVNSDFPLFQAVDSNSVWRGIGGGSSNSVIARSGNSNDPNLISSMYRTAGHTYQFTFKASAGSEMLKVYDENMATSDVTNGIYTTGYNIPDNIHLFARGNVFMGAGCQVSYIRFYKNGVLAANFLPCRYGATIGLYDLVNKSFRTASRGLLLAGNDTVYEPNPNSPIPITCNNGEIHFRDDDETFYCDGPEEEVEIGPSYNYSALCEMLLKLKTGQKIWQDKQNIVTGEITRMVGIKVLDGSELWIYDPSYNRFYTDIPECIRGTVARVYPALCTHFRNLHNQESMSSINTGDFYIGNNGRLYFHDGVGDVVAWQNWLNNRRANNDPVIIVFPLETETQEQVVPQTMRTENGNNRAEITQAAVPNLELLATYTEVV